MVETSSAYRSLILLLSGHMGRLILFSLLSKAEPL